MWHPVVKVRFHGSVQGQAPAVRHVLSEKLVHTADWALHCFVWMVDGAQVQGLRCPGCQAISCLLCLSHIFT